MIEALKSAVMISGQYGAFEYSYDLLFILSLLLSILIVMVFAVSKVNEPTFEKKKDDSITKMLPKELSSRDEYFRALVIYVSLLVLFVVVLSLLGPKPLSSFGITKAPEAPAALPIFLTLLLVGLLPSVPLLRELERQFRRFAHERASIPEAARNIVEKLSAADFDFSAYSKLAGSQSVWFRGVTPSDLLSNRGALEYSWARLCCLLYAIHDRLGIGGASEFAPELFEKYQVDLDNIGLKKRAFEGDISRYKAGTLSSSDDLHHDIRETLRAVYAFLGCAVRLRNSAQSDFEETLKKFGLVLAPTRPVENKDIMIVGLGATTLLVFIVVFAASGLPTVFGWSPSLLYPVKAMEPYIYSLSTLLAQGSAIFFANAMRSRSMRRDKWLTENRDRKPENYVILAVFCGLVGYIVQLSWGLTVWSFSRGWPSFGLFETTLPLAILPAVTGVFYAYHLDTVELKQSPPILWEIGVQAIVTGLFSYVSASAWVALISAQHPELNYYPDYDYLILLVSIGVCIGGALGWYIPKAARNRYCRNVEVKSAWNYAIKATAEKVLGDPQAVSFWLQSPQDGLNNQTPGSAVIDRQTFEVGLKELQKQASAR
jgi:hypothetical protein